MNDFERYCKNRIKFGFFRFIFLLLFACIIFFLSSKFNLFSSYVYALETETIYATNNNCTLSDSGKYKSADSNGLLTNKNINTTYNGKSYYMRFSFEETILTTKVNEIKITFMSNDLLQKVVPNYIKVKTYDNTCESDWATILSIEKNTNSGNITTITIDYMPQMTSTKADVLIGSDTTIMAITGETTYGIKSVQTGDRDSQGNEDIIINNNQNTQNIINNQEQNAQNIIDNQNQNTQDIIDAQKVCKDALTYKGYLSNTSIFANNNLVYFERYTGLKTFIYESSENKTYSFKFKNYNRLRVYESNTLYTDSDTPFNISGSLLIDNSSPTIDATYQITTTKKYIYFSLSNTSSNTGEIEIEQVCVNGNQAVNDSINNLTETLTDTNVDTSSLNNVVGWLPAGPVDSIINLPLTLFNSLLSAFNLTCSDIELPLPFVNTNMKLPCLGSLLRQITGFWVWYETIGAMVAGIILYNYLLALYNWVDQTLSMRENTLPGYYEDRWGGGA